MTLTKIRTNAMQVHERAVIFPDRKVHNKLATLDDGALWEARDAQGNLLVNRNIYSSGDVANAQDAIKTTMKTVSYLTDEDDNSQLVGRQISTDTIDNPCLFTFNDPKSSSPMPQRTAVAPLMLAANTDSSPSPIQGATTPLLIQKRELSQDEFEQLLAQASLPLAQGFKSIGRKIKEATKRAVSVTVGAFKDLGSAVVGGVKKVVQVLVTTYENVADKVGEVIKKVENFIIDTAEKATAFVEGIVEKIGVTVTKMVEFLRALFNWKDILSTQRYLANAVDEGLRYAVKLADAAKEPMKAFMSDLRKTVQDNLDATIKDLGGDESDLQKSGIELPEELEWFLSKLMSGLSRSSPDSINQIINPGSSSEPLEKFMSNLLTKFERISKIMFRSLEGLGEVITKLISNPYRPQVALIAILKAVRDVMDEFLKLLEGIAIEFLNIIGFMVEKLRELITMEISIPFVTAFFKKIGAGQLNALNLGCLLLAIPVTISSKLLLHQKPFEGEPPLALSVSKNAKKTWKIVSISCLFFRTIYGLGETEINYQKAKGNKLNKQSSRLKSKLKRTKITLNTLSLIASIPSIADLSEKENLDMSEHSQRGAFVIRAVIWAFECYIDVCGEIGLEMEKVDSVRRYSKSLMSMIQFVWEHSSLELSINTQAR